MPKLTDAVLATRSIKKFNNYKPNPYKYKISLPPVLRDFISNKSEKSNQAICTQEMYIMMACWKKHEFDLYSCSPEIEQFDKCVVMAKAKANMVKESVATGRIIEGSKRHPSSQINKLLSRYPQSKAHFKLKV